MNDSIMGSTACYWDHLHLGEVSSTQVRKCLNLCLVMKVWNIHVSALSVNLGDKLVFSKALTSFCVIWKIWVQKHGICRFHHFLFSQIVEAVTLSNDERESWRCAFYHGPAFPTMSKILLGSKCTTLSLHLSIHKQWIVSASANCSLILPWFIYVHCQLQSHGMY